MRNKNLTRLSLAVGIGVVATSLLAPVASAASVPAGTDQLQGTLGVSMEIRNLSITETIKIHDRNTGREVVLKPGKRTTFSENFSTAPDELELHASTSRRNEGEDIDVSNPTLEWSNVTVENINRNFATNETRYYISDSNLNRYKVHRANDSGSHKVFYPEMWKLQGEVKQWSLSKPPAMKT